MKRFLTLPMLILLAACSQPLAPRSPATPADTTSYPAAAASGAAVYAVDAGNSLVTVVVRRDGPMARLGHDHVVAIHTLSGYAAPGLARADLSFRVDEMTVDEPQLLRDAGLDSHPSPEAIAGTRKNMLGPVLDAERYPLVTLHAEQPANGPLRVAITLHGTTHPLALPAEVRVDAERITATGTAHLKQTDFGITPFSVGGGLLSVQDELEVRFHITLRRRMP